MKIDFDTIINIIASKAIEIAKEKGVKDATGYIGEAVNATSFLNDYRTCARIIAESPNGDAIDSVPEPKNGKGPKPTDKKVESVKRCLNMMAFYAILDAVKQVIAVKQYQQSDAL